jgi:DNA-binding XRE family transcriptional regulator
MFQISLRSARINSGYTAQEVAESLNISPKTLWKYERAAGEMPLRAAVKILSLYRISVDDVYFGGESEFIKSRNVN